MIEDLNELIKPCSISYIGKMNYLNRWKYYIGILSPDQVPTRYGFNTKKDMDEFLDYMEAVWKSRSKISETTVADIIREIIILNIDKKKGN